jgi:hypothetical protein
MKKTLLLSVVAASAVMAGGNISPVVAQAATGWDFSGTAKLYYQTVAGDYAGGSVFDQEQSAGNAGLQLRATNANLMYGFGAGVEVSALSTLGLQDSVVSTIMQPATDEEHRRGGWISQAYLTYVTGNTTLKVGRQTLPKSLSPMAFSEDWNVWANTFDAALLVNTDITDTTLVVAAVRDWNTNSSLLDKYNTTDFGFAEGNGLDENVYMITLQNKSFENTTLTGSYYTADLADEDFNALWGDAQLAVGSLNVGLQAARVQYADYDDTTAYGAKIAGTYNGINLMAAYSSVNDGELFVQNVAGSTSALYTDTPADQLLNDPEVTYGDLTRRDTNKVVVSANTDMLGGNVTGIVAKSNGANEQTEIAGVYAKDLGNNLNVTAAYVHLNGNMPLDGTVDVSEDVVRVVGTYNF